MWPPADETRELLDLAAAGDAAAVARLIERHRDALRRLIAARLDRGVARRVDASDVVQDVLVDVHRRLADYLADQKMPFHLWLRQLAQDRMIDAYRRHRAAARRSTDREQPLAAAPPDRSAFDLAAQLRDGQPTPATAATRRELAERFGAAIDALDPIDREVIVMRHFEQLANQEVAQALGLSEPAAGMRYLRALRRLRAALDADAAESCA